MKNLCQLKKYFQSAIDANYLKFSHSVSHGNEYINVEFRSCPTATPSKDGYEYKPLAVITVNCDTAPLLVCQQITMFLTVALISADQDTNILMAERIK